MNINSIFLKYNTVTILKWVFMNLRNKIFLLGIFIIFISTIGVYSVSDYQNTDNIPVVFENNNESDMIGCCSIILQEDGNNTLMSYRRDSDLDADIFIEKVDWHGIPAIKQYKTDNNYFCHVIITENGWVIGLGGTDDGIDNQIAENITADMITEDNSISQEGLEKIQKLKQPYGRGHVVIKAPNGNYGFANVDKLKTGKLEPGHYISIPNDYSYSRAGEISLDSPDKIREITDLSQQDLYGLDRREIITYDININNTENKTDIYVANENGSYLGVDNTGFIDDIYVNNTLVKGSDIPIAPGYKEIGSFSFINDTSNPNRLSVLIFMVLFAVFVALLYFVILRFVKFIRYRR